MKAAGPRMRGGGFQICSHPDFQPGYGDFLRCLSPQFMRREARLSAFCWFQTFNLRFECIGATTNFFRFHSHERPVVGGEGVLI